MANDRFVAWVKKYGISRLTRDLGKGANRRIIYDWLRGSTRPRIPVAVQIWELSHQYRPDDGKGPLTFNDILNLPTELSVQAASRTAIVCEARA